MKLKLIQKITPTEVYYYTTKDGVIVTESLSLNEAEARKRFNILLDNGTLNEEIELASFTDD